MAKPEYLQTLAKMSDNSGLNAGAHQKRRLVEYLGHASMHFNLWRNLFQLRLGMRVFILVILYDVQSMLFGATFAYTCAF